MRNTGYIAILFILLTAGPLAAQDVGVVRFMVDNDNGYFEIQLEDSTVIRQYKDTLPVGSYQAKAWSQGYDVKDFSFQVFKDSITDIHVKLDRSTAYQAYAQSYRNYRMKFHKAITLPLSLSLATGVAGGICMLKAYDLQRDIRLQIESYHQSAYPDEIADIKESIETDNRRYNFYRTGFYVASGLTVLGVATTIYSGIRFRRNEVEPVYSKESPFLERTSLNFTPYGCTIRFKIG